MKLAHIIETEPNAHFRPTLIVRARYGDRKTRNIAIVRQALDGVTFTQIAKIHSMSVSNVTLILNRFCTTAILFPREMNRKPLTLARFLIEYRGWLIRSLNLENLPPSRGC